MDPCDSACIKQYIYKGCLDDEYLLQCNIQDQHKDECHAQIFGQCLEVYQSKIYINYIFYHHPLHVYVDITKWFQIFFLPSDFYIFTSINCCLYNYI